MNAKTKAGEKVKAKRKRKPITPRSKIKNALRRLWLYSRERNEALKLAGRCCAACGVKASVAKGREQKLEVHHKEGIGIWEKVTDLIYAELLTSQEKLQVLCPECHKKIHVELEEQQMTNYKKAVHKDGA